MVSRLLAVLICASFTLSAATIYTDRALFEASPGTFLVDSYSPADGYPAGFGVYNNATMSGFFGETVYTSTGHSNLNIVSGVYYCAGCNGSFNLNFTSTSVGDATGVFGVGLDIVFNDSTLPYTAFVTFGDAATQNHALPSGASFWGITDSVGIASIHFGLPNGGSTAGGSFGIDNLTIGSVGSSEIPEPSFAIPVALALGLLGLRSRRRAA